MPKSFKARSKSVFEETARVRLCYERLRISVDREINGNDPLVDNIERINLRTMHILLHRITPKIVRFFSRLCISFSSFFKIKNNCIDRLSGKHVLVQQKYLTH